MDEVKIGSDIPVIAYTRNASGVLQNADSGPTYAVFANGASVLTGQTFTNVTTGHYFDTCTISVGNGFAVGDLIEVKATATVDSVTDSNPLFVGKVVAAIAEDNYSRIGANGAGLTTLATAAELAKVPKSDGTATWNATALASINAEADTALSDYGALKPTTAGRTLDVTATGAAGIDWGNVENPTTVVGLSGTTIKTATDVETDTADIQSRIPAALSAGRMKCDMELAFGNSAGAQGLADFGANGYSIATQKVFGVVLTDSVEALGTQAKADVNAEADTALTDYGALKPTDAGRTLDVSAEGGAGLDWSNIHQPTSVVDLSGTTIKTATDIAIDIATVLAKLQGLVLETATIGATGNSTTAIHLPGLTYGDDEINNYLLVIRDVSEDEYHARWITDWVASTAVATVATLPFTPQNSTDTYWLLSARADVTGGSGPSAADIRTEMDANSTKLASIDAKTTNLPASPAATGDIPSAATNASAVRTELATELARVDVATSTRLASASYTAPPSASTNASAVRTELTTELGRMDAAVSTRATPAQVATELATYDGPTNAEMVARTLSAADYATATNLATVDSVVDSILAGQAALSTLTEAQVLTKVNEALDTAIAELGIGTPATTPSIRTGLMLLYMAKLNDSDDSSTRRRIKNAAGTTIAQATVASSGSGVSQGKLVSP